MQAHKRALPNTCTTRPNTCTIKTPPTKPTHGPCNIAFFAKKASGFAAVVWFFCVFFAFYSAVTILLEQERKAPVSSRQIPKNVIGLRRAASSLCTLYYPQGGSPAVFASVATAPCPLSWQSQGKPNLKRKLCFQKIKHQQNYAYCSKKAKKQKKGAPLGDFRRGFRREARG